MRTWQSTIPAEAVRSYRLHLRLLTKLVPRVSGLMFSKVFATYLQRQMVKGVDFPLGATQKRRISVTRCSLLENRSRFDPLIDLFRKWARAERTLTRYDVWQDEGEVLYELPVTERHRWRRELMLAVKETVALVAFNCTTNELVTLASLGDDESLLRLVQLDKIFLTAAFCQKRIRQAQGLDDRKFFESLARSLVVDAYRERLAEAKLGVACYLLWFLGFEELPKRELFAFLDSEGLVPYRDPQSFYRMLTRIGLTKYKKVGRRGG